MAQHVSYSRQAQLLLHALCWLVLTIPLPGLRGQGPTGMPEPIQGGPEMKSVSFGDLYKKARIASGGVVPDEARESLPLPVLEKNQLYVDFLFFPSRLDGKGGVELMPPSHRVRLAPDGDLIFCEAVDVARLRPGHRPFQVLGTFAMPPGMTAKEFLEQRARFEQLLVPLCAAFQKHDLDEKLSAQAKELSQIMGVIREKPVLDYYQIFGKQFLAYLHELLKD